MNVKNLELELPEIEWLSISLDEIDYLGKFEIRFRSFGVWECFMKRLAESTS